jgi:hypothetical protein
MKAFEAVAVPCFSLVQYSSVDQVNSALRNIDTFKDRKILIPTAKLLLKLILKITR